MLTYLKAAWDERGIRRLGHALAVAAEDLDVQRIAGRQELPICGLYQDEEGTVYRLFLGIREGELSYTVHADYLTASLNRVLLSGGARNTADAKVPGSTSNVINLRGYDPQRAADHIERECRLVIPASHLSTPAGEEEAASLYRMGRLVERSGNPRKPWSSHRSRLTARYFNRRLEEAVASIQSLSE